MSATSLFQRVIGPAFAALPPVVQQVHEPRLPKRLRGRCDVERGEGLLGNLAAAAAGLPPAATDVPLVVTIEGNADGETWTRDFDGHRMRSRLRVRSGLLAERLGPMTLLFRLDVRDGRLAWQVGKARYLGVPLPASWFAAVDAVEEEHAGRYAFSVRVTLPVVGLLVAYRGWLAADE